jgi:putative peptidoglycan lipid II flippase
MSIKNSMPAASSKSSLVKSASIIGIATLLSRLLGFIRDIVIARLFGVYVYAQAFVVAFKIPNLFRDLVAEGAANAAFVPVFSEYRATHTKEEFWELANVVLNLLLILLSAVTLIGIAFAPFIVRVIAPGFSTDPQKLATTISLTRIIFPYLLLISLAAYAMAILNTLKHFSVPAFAPCLLNVSIIVFALLFGENIFGLSLGVLMGGALQLIIQVPVLYKKGFRIIAPKKLSHPAAKEIGRLMVPRLGSSAIYQLNNFVDSIFGSLARIVGEGGVAILYFAYRLIMFPIGIFSNALSQAILPTFSEQALEAGRDNLRKTLSFGLRSLFFVMVPASIGFMVLAYPIISTLFQGGRFDAYSTNATSSVLVFYSIGLCAYGATKILQSCFFALKDTLTPTKVAGIALLVNIVLNIIFMFPLKLAGLALATSLSGINTFFMLFYILRKKLAPFDAQPILVSFTRILLASLCMGLVCYFATYSEKLTALNKYINLAFLLSLGVVTYVAFCVLLRVPEMKELREWLCRRK